MRVHIILLAALFLLGCGKDSGSAPPSCDPCLPTLSPYLALSVDSACLKAGNVFTPNSDGINDLPVVIAVNVTDVGAEVRHLDGTLIYTGDHSGLFNFGPWPGPLAGSPPLPLQLTVQGTSLSGQLLQGSAIIYSVTLPQEQCFSESVAPVTGDQFVDANGFPFSCEPSGPSYDNFCLQ